MSKLLSLSLAIFAALFVASCANPSGSDTTTGGTSTSGGTSTTGGTGTSGGTSTTGGTSTSGWNIWHDTTVITAANPISFTYDSSTNTAAITVASVNNSTDIWRMNAACQVGTLTADTYVVSFSAWTSTGTKAITSNLQEEATGGTTGYFDATLTTTPTKYCYTASFASACAAQVTFNCNSSTGTFSVKDVTVTKKAAYPLVLPTDASAAYNSAKGRTIVTFSCIPAADHIYLYESTTNVPSTATLLTDFNQSTGNWSREPSREQIMASNSSPKSGFLIAGYSSSRTYYYWISVQKSGGSESSKISAGSVTVTGDFTNYAYIPSDASCDSIDNSTWYFSGSVAGTVAKEFFYASSGTTITFGDDNYANTATVGVKIYLAAATPSVYVLGDSSDYNYVWQTTDRTFTIPTSGYYIIEQYIKTAGDYHIKLSD